MLANKNKVKIVAIAKDEARYITEWIYHHAYFGFDAFDIYVNNTTDDTPDILKRLSAKFNINIIMADALYLNNPSAFQTNAYKQSLLQAQKDGYSHLAFLDIDEFWTPKDFATSVHDMLANAKHFDVLVFNWAVHRSESPFSRCFAKVNEFINDRHVKAIIKLGKPERISIHSAFGANLSYGNSDFNPPTFLGASKAKIKVASDQAPSAFVVHRVCRSQVEYVSMLCRGRPRGDRFKSNRVGYYINNNNGYQFIIDSKKLDAYYDGLNKVIDSCGLVKPIQDAEHFVIERYRQFIELVHQGVSVVEAISLLRALKNITLPEVLDIKSMLKDKADNIKIFQIGFNKSGTASIYHYFKSEGFKAIHWDGGRLSKTIKDNAEQGLPLLTGYEGYQVFTDMEHREADQSAFYSAEEYFKQLDQQYPESIFILNYRDINRWLQSRRNHPGYLQKTVQSTGCSVDEVIEAWKTEYYDHIAAVKAYFENKPNLITLDLDKADNQALFRALAARGIVLNQKTLPHVHKTKMNPEQKKKHIDAIRNAALFFEKDNLETAYMLMKVAHELRPEGKFIERKLNEFEAKLVADD